MAMPFDPETIAAGTPAPVVEGLLTNRVEAMAEYAVSDNGVLAYMEGSSELERWLVRLAPGKPPERLNISPLSISGSYLTISPDGRRVAVSLDGDTEIWTFDLERGDLDLLVTSGPGFNWCPIWSPDGSEITFVSNREGDWGFYSQSIDGVGEPEALLETPGNKWLGSWTPDGGTLVFVTSGQDTGGDIWTATKGADVTTSPFLASSASMWSPALSPDGRWLAYQSYESGKSELYVVSFPAMTTKWKVSRGGGRRPRWKSDGSRIYFQSDSDVMVVDVVDDVRFSASEPTVFVKGVDPVGNTWDVAPDGSCVIAVERRPPPRLRIILNFFEELKRLVPTD
jgi:Tol biopolymer transport system component